MIATPTVKQPSFPLLVSYAHGNFGKNALASLVGLYALFYFTDILDISPGIAGLILLVTLVWDAVSDPLVGYLGDKYRLRWQSLKPYAIISIPLTAIAFIALFHLSALPNGVIIPGAVFCLIFFRTAYTLFDVPHNGLLAVITYTPKQRTLAASLRIFFSAFGKLVVTLVVAWVVSSNADSELNERGIRYASYILVVIFLFSTSFCAWSVRNINLNRNADVTTAPHWPDILNMILKDRKIRGIFLLTSLNSLSIPVIASGFIYYAKYGLGEEPVSVKALIFLAIAQTISLLFWAFISNHTKSKTRTCLMAYLLLSIASIMGILIAYTTAGIYLTAIFTGLSIGGIFMLNWSMLPDALDEYRVKSGRYGDLGVFGIYTFANKTFHGLSQAYVGFVLAILGFSANAHTTSFSIDHIRQVIFILPLLAALLCIYVIRFMDK